MKVLIIEASGIYCSLGLFDYKRKKILKAFISKRYKKRNHSEIIIQMVKDIFLNLEKEDISSIKYIVVSRGPGSFTGIRAAISVSEGLSLSLKIPIIGINVFEKLFWIVQEKINPKTGILTISNTRRGYHFVKIHSMFDREDFDKEIQILPINKINKTSGLYNFDKIVVIGDDALEISKELKRIGIETLMPIKTIETYGNLGLKIMAQIALNNKNDRLKNKIKPLYLTEPITN